MKKILILLVALSFLSVDAQAKKKKTTKKKTKKTTAVAEKQAAQPAAVVSTPAASTDNSGAEELEPINSMSILNAKSPASFRIFREIGTVKKGDSLVSFKTKPLDYGYID